MNESTFYVSDLDGTLLDRNGYLSPTSRRRLEQLLADGLPFTVASARSWISIRERLGPLPLRLPVVEFNGAFITDYATGEKLAIESIETGDAARIAEGVEESGAAYFISTYFEKEDRVYVSQKQNPGLESYLQERRNAEDPRLREVQHWNRHSEEKVVCMTAVCRRDRLERLREAIAARTESRVVMHLWEDSYIAGWHWLMIHHANACKGKALKSLQKRLGWEGRPLTVFGDEVNDLGMMELADQKIAVANACSAVRDMADLVLGPHYDDVVSKFLIDQHGKSPCMSAAGQV